MIHRPQPWLPPAPPGGFERQLRPLIVGWAERWLRDRAPCTVSVHESAAEEACNWRGSASAAVGATPGELVALGKAVLGGRGDCSNGRDRAILASLAQAASDDLAAMLCEIAAPGDHVEEIADVCPSAIRATHWLAGDGWRLALTLGPTAQVRLRRSIAGTQRKPSMSRLCDALAPERVALGCHLGHAMLAAADVSALAPGDLVVLDRSTADLLPLTVCGKPASGDASVQSDKDSISVRILEPIDLTQRSD